MLNSTIFDEFNALRRELNRVFDGSEATNSDDERGWVSAPAVESGWTEDHLNLRFVLPGVPEDKVDMTLQGNTLVIRGERPAPENFAHKGQAFYRLPYGKLERKVDLPNGLSTDKIEATMHHGVLDLRIPIAEAMKPKRIEIQASDSGKRPKTIAAA